MSLSSPHRLLVIVGAAAGACAIAVPAALGLSDNPSFSQRIPVRAPSSAHIVTIDDHGDNATEVIHKRHGHRVGAGHDDDPSSTTSGGVELEPGDDRGTAAEPGDDRGDRSGTHAGHPDRNRGSDDGTHERAGHGGGGHDGGRDGGHGDGGSDG